MSIWITADMLTIGDKIIEADGKRTIAVKALDPCSTKGVRKMHVNDSLCYDTLTKIEVIPAHRQMPAYSPQGYLREIEESSKAA